MVQLYLFQTSTSVNNLFVKMADPVLTSMDPTRVSVQPGGRGSTANKVWNHGVVLDLERQQALENNLCIDLQCEIFSITISISREINIFSIDKDECAEGRCLNNAQCYNSEGSYMCVCPQGWTGRNCEVGKFFVMGSD